MHELLPVRLPSRWEVPARRLHLLWIAFNPSYPVSSLRTPILIQKYGRAFMETPVEESQ